MYVCLIPQGYPPDESDDEWDDHILRSYGSIAARQSTDRREESAGDDYDLTNCVESSFNMYDRLFSERFGEPQPRQNGDNDRQEDSAEIIWDEHIDMGPGSPQSNRSSIDRGNPKGEVPALENIESPVIHCREVSPQPAEDNENVDAVVDE